MAWGSLSQKELLYRLLVSCILTLHDGLFHVQVIQCVFETRTTPSIPQCSSVRACFCCDEFLWKTGCWLHRTKSFAWVLTHCLTASVTNALLAAFISWNLFSSNSSAHFVKSRLGYTMLTRNAPDPSRHHAFTWPTSLLFQWNSRDDMWDGTWPAIFQRRDKSPRICEYLRLLVTARANIVLWGCHEQPRELVVVNLRDFDCSDAVQPAF